MALAAWPRSYGGIGWEPASEPGPFSSARVDGLKLFPLSRRAWLPRTGCAPTLPTMRIPKKKIPKKMRAEDFRELPLQDQVDHLLRANRVLKSTLEQTLRQGVTTEEWAAPPSSIRKESQLIFPHIASLLLDRRVLAFFISESSALQKKERRALRKRRT